MSETVLLMRPCWRLCISVECISLILDSLSLSLLIPPKTFSVLFCYCSVVLSSHRANRHTHTKHAA